MESKSLRGMLTLTSVHFCLNLSIKESHQAPKLDFLIKTGELHPCVRSLVPNWPLFSSYLTSILNLLSY